MRKHSAQAPRAPITNPHQLSRYLFQLVKGQGDLDFSSDLAYPTEGRSVPVKPWEEVLTIEIENDGTEADDESEDEFEQLRLTVTTYTDGTYDYMLDVTSRSDYTREGTNLDEAADQVYAAIWLPTKPDIPEIPIPTAKPHIKLMQQALTNGPQTIWLSWLDITKFNSVNELVTFQVSCAMVGHAVHIADVDHFLRAIDFDLNVLNAPKHAIAQRVLAALKNGVKNKADIEGSAKLNDSKGQKYLAFLLELQDGVGTVHGMIDMRPEDEDDEEEEEVDD
jgi:hypothetical protein